MVTSSTRGVSGQRASISRSTRAVVDLPTATEPATPMTNGVPLASLAAGTCVVTRCSAPVAADVQVRAAGRAAGRSSRPRPGRSGRPGRAAARPRRRQRQRGRCRQRRPRGAVELDERGHPVPVEHRNAAPAVSSATDATGTSLSPAMRRNSAARCRPRYPHCSLHVTCDLRLIRGDTRSRTTLRCADPGGRRPRTPSRWPGRPMACPTAAYHGPMAHRRFDRTPRCSPSPARWPTGASTPASPGTTATRSASNGRPSGRRPVRPLEPRRC